MKIIVFGVSAAIALAMLAAPASARIVCKNGYQLVSGNYISTPFCRDNYLGQVARQYGMRVSDVAIRENPNIKRDACRFVGRDIRVQQHCGQDESGRGRR